MKIKRALIAVLAIVAILCAVVSGTIAYLNDQTEKVTNTFTVGNINIELTETTTDYKMVPGNEIAKDPKVTVIADSEPCWLFVKVEEKAIDGKKFSDYIIYDMASGWTAGTMTDGSKGNGVPVGVYFREDPVPSSETDTDFDVIGYNTSDDPSVFVEDKVLVKDTVTKAMMDELEAEGAQLPTLSFKAYAVQRDSINSAAEAWAQIPAENQ